MSNDAIGDGSPADDELKTRYEILCERENLYREMIENVNSVILRWNTELRIVFINRFGAQLFGYETDELIGARLLGTIVEESETTGRSLTSMLADIVEHPENYINNENENKTKDGRTLWISWTNQPIYDSESRMAGILSVGNDITSLKSAEKEQARLNRELRRALDANEFLLKETEDLNHKLAIMASTDQLTGLINRRSLNDKLAEECFRSQRYSYAVGVLMVDIDHFKQINDNWGHQVGDTALKIVSQAISSSLRRADIAGRYGGEEICIILPYASMQLCWSIAERIRMIVEQTTADLTAKRELPRTITVSIGGASSESGITTEDELIKHADEALYKSKDSGRNKVTIFGFSHEDLTSI